MSTYRLNNQLSDKEAKAFVSVRNVESIITKFMSFENPEKLTVKNFTNAKGRAWPVLDLCTVYNLDKFEAMNRLQRLMAEKKISGYVTISR